MFKIPDLDDVDEYGLTENDSLKSKFKANKKEISSDELLEGETSGRPGSCVTKSSRTAKPATEKTEDLPQQLLETSKAIHKELSNAQEKLGLSNENKATLKEGHIEASRAKPSNQSSNKTYSILVNPRQKGNPLLKHIQNVPWEYSEIEPDYIMGQTTCALFLSLKYHNLYPSYIHDRLKSLGKSFQLQVLLVLVDVTDPHASLRELSKIAILTDCTLMLAWSPEEAGRYIETYKAFESKPADLIMEKKDSDRYSNLIDALTSVKSVNRTDAITLLATFGTMEKIMKATPDELSLCPGMGPQKARRLYDILHQPFLKTCSS